MTPVEIVAAYRAGTLTYPHAYGLREQGWAAVHAGQASR